MSWNVLRGLPYGKTGGFERQGVVLGIGVRAHGFVGHIYPMRIGKKLKADGCILQIILSLVLGYPGSLDPGEFLFIILPSSVEDRKDHIFVPSVLESVILIVTKEKHLGTGDLLKGGHIQFHNLEWHDL